MGKTIYLARPLPTNGPESRARKMGDSCEHLRDATDISGHHLTWVKFTDGEHRVLVDRDIAEDSYSSKDHQPSALPTDARAIWSDWEDYGGEM